MHGLTAYVSTTKANQQSTGKETNTEEQLEFTNKIFYLKRKSVP